MITITVFIQRKTPLINGDIWKENIHCFPTRVLCSSAHGIIINVRSYIFRCTPKECLINPIIYGAILKRDVTEYHMLLVPRDTFIALQFLTRKERSSIWMFSLLTYRMTCWCHSLRKTTVEEPFIENEKFMNFEVMSILPNLLQLSLGRHFFFLSIRLRILVIFRQVKIPSSFQQNKIHDKIFYGDTYRYSTYTV